jgi:hypothetical protein
VFRLRLFGQERRRVDPGKPHRFQQVDDAGMGAMAAGAGNRGSVQSAVGPVALADNYIRKSNCGVPGCGKPRYDAIHEPTDG